MRLETKNKNKKNICDDLHCAYLLPKFPHGSPFLIYKGIPKREAMSDTFFFFFFWSFLSNIPHMRFLLLEEKNNF